MQLNGTVAPEINTNCRLIVKLKSLQHWRHAFGILDTYIELHVQVAFGMYTLQTILLFLLQHVYECYILIAWSKT